MQQLLDNDANNVDPLHMLAEQRDDNLRLTQEMRQVRELCSSYNDVPTISLLESWIDETEWRTWCLYEASHSRFKFITAF